MEAPYGYQLLHQAPSLAHNYKTGVEVKDSGKHSILLGHGINYGHVIRNILDLMLIELSHVMSLMRTLATQQTGPNATKLYMTVIYKCWQ